MHFSYVCFHLLIIDSNCLLLKGGFRNLHVFFSDNNFAEYLPSLWRFTHNT
jgi:hypothetical protein